MTVMTEARIGRLLAMIQTLLNQFFQAALLFGIGDPAGRLLGPTIAQYEGMCSDFTAQQGDPGQANRIMKTINRLRHGSMEPADATCLALGQCGRREPDALHRYEHPGPCLAVPGRGGERASGADVPLCSSCMEDVRVCRPRRSIMRPNDSGSGSAAQTTTWVATSSPIPALIAALSCILFG